jgi:hypothetical protein
MKTRHRRAVAAVSATMIALGGAALALVRVAGPTFPGWIGAVYAQEEGGGHGGGGGKKGGGGERGGGESGGCGGCGGGGGMGESHGGGGEMGGRLEKGHGTRYRHQGHASGSHSGHDSAHEAGGDRFGGGSGLRGNAQVPEGVGRYGAGLDALSATEQRRFRYWGGWSLPEQVAPTPTTSSATPTSSETIPNPTVPHQ